MNALGQPIPKRLKDPAWRPPVAYNMLDVARGKTNALMGTQMIPQQAFSPEVMKVIPPQNALTLGDMASFGINAAPFVGDAVAIEDAKKEYQKGNIGTAAFNALTALPLIGDVATAAKVTLPAMASLGGLAGMMSRGGKRLPPTGAIGRQRGAIGGSDDMARALAKLESNYKQAPTQARLDKLNAFKQQNMSRADMLRAEANTNRYGEGWDQPQEVIDYGMQHRPSGREQGASLDDLSNIYPDDIYGSQGAQYYGHYGQNHPMDRQSVDIINRFKGKPSQQVTIYRAVPYEKTNTEKLAKLDDEMKAYMKRRTIPSDDTSGLTGSAWYDDAWDRHAELEKTAEIAGDIPAEKLNINEGDWVSINRNYAKEHGEAQLGGNYKIITKKVKAGDIFTSGDSIHEWGYSPK